MICKLCLNNRPLIKKSHIIPDFMYKYLYDDSHKIRMFSPYETSRGEGYIKKPSTGIYESGILCADCDNKIIGDNYENYVSIVFYGGNLQVNEDPIFETFTDVDGISFTTYKNISYKKYKLFLLSILRRASISTNPFFNSISLGLHSEILRKMVFEGEPGNIDDYAIAFLTYKIDKSLPIDLIAQPLQKIDKTGHTECIFMICGIIYIFYINSNAHQLCEEALMRTIKPENEMTILHFPEGKGKEFIYKYYGLT